MHIPQLKPWSLVEVLTQKYGWTFEKARSFAAFLLPMLAYEPDERATAEQCLRHNWLKPQPVEKSPQQQLSPGSSTSPATNNNNNKIKTRSAAKQQQQASATSATAYEI
jgi:serine/threonine protein kinase